MPVDVLAPWVLTYLLHSTLLLGAAWLLTTLWRRAPVGLQESLWRTALLGGVLTASAQMVVGWEPWSGHLAVPQLAAERSAPRAAADGPVAPAPPEAVAVVAPPDAAEAPPRPTWATTGAERSAHPRFDPSLALGALWLAGLLVLAFRSRRARRVLHRRLAARRAVPAGALRERLDALRAAAGLRRPIALSESEALGSPLALGIRRPEIVVPLRATRELSPAQQEVMLAHELAHHVRRDPLWLALTRALCTVLFFQPLNLLATRRLRETSELLSDAWAAEHTGRGRELAECLTTVAGWVLHGGAPLAVPAMAAYGSMLERRVACLLDAGSSRPGRRRAAQALACVPLLLVAGLAPAIAAAGAGTPAVPTAEERALAPVEEADGVLARLDAEIAALQADVTVLLDLLAQVSHPPETLRQGTARLAARLEALTERRVALVRDAEEMKR